jgi:hypothetical protein
MKVPDYVERRIVVEIGRQYAYVYMTDGNGKIVPQREESFKQPYRMDRQEAASDAVDLWDLVYDHLNETINFPLPEGGDDESDSEKED